MARRGARRTAALGLALRLLLGLGLGLDAAPVPALPRPRAPAQGSCAPGSLQCRASGYCVPLSWRCDGDRDCLDGSDEEECRIEPCAQDGQCPPPSRSPCPCAGGDCPGGGGGDGSLDNCTRPACPAGELRCRLGGPCIPRTWLCDGHPDCPDAGDELGCGTEALQGANATATATPATPTYLRNASATSTSAGRWGADQPGNRSAYGVVAAAVALSAGVAAAAALVLCRLCARACPPRVGLLLLVKESLLPPERKASLI